MQSWKPRRTTPGAAFPPRNHLNSFALTRKQSYFMETFGMRKGHQWEAHALTKELQGCQAHTGLLKRKAEGKVGASRRHSQPVLSRLRTIWEDTGVSCCSSPTSSIVIHKTDIWLQQCRHNKNFLCIVEFIFQRHCPHFLSLFMHKSCQIVSIKEAWWGGHIWYLLAVTISIQIENILALASGW